jgi:hypothetical protein
MNNRHLVLMLFLNFIFIKISAQNITPLLGQKRLLLVFESSKDTDFFNRQKGIAEAHLADFVERDLVVIQVGDPALYRRYGVKSDKNTLLLIGKDGSPKWRSQQVADAKTLFALIDAMPMRRAEMVRRKNKN